MEQAIGGIIIGLCIIGISVCLTLYIIERREEREQKRIF